MSDFSYLEAYQVPPEIEATYTFHDIKGQPTITMRPATDDNPQFLDGRLRETIEKSQQPRKAIADEELTVEELKKRLEEAREGDRKTIAFLCATGWTVRDKDDNEVPFSAEECYAFLSALPHRFLDPLRNWSVNIRNFIRGRVVSEADAERMGNS